MAIQKKRVSIRDVAKKAGVSRSTVSLVLNNSPVPKSATREKVLEVVRRLNYQPDPLFGKAVRQRHSGEQAKRELTQTIGFFARELLLNQAHVNDGFYSRVLAGIQLAVEKHDYHLMIKAASENDFAPPTIVTENRVDGLVLQGDLPEVLLKLLVDRLPVAIVDRRPSSIKIDSVMPNIENAIEEQLTYLFELGHRNIVKFNSRSSRDTLHEKLFARAFHNFFDDAREPILQPALCEPQQINTATHGEVMDAFARRIAEASPRPTALVTWDAYACSLVPRLRQLGLRVPEDISVIGMDDTLDAQMLKPQLTSYRFAMEDMGRSATELLLARIKDRSRPAHELLINGKLIERATCSSAPTA